ARSEEVVRQGDVDAALNRGTEREVEVDVVGELFAIHQALVAVGEEGQAGRHAQGLAIADAPLRLEAAAVTTAEQRVVAVGGRQPERGAAVQVNRERERLGVQLSGPEDLERVQLVTLGVADRHHDQIAAAGDASAERAGPQL